MTKKPQKTYEKMAIFHNPRVHALIYVFFISIPSLHTTYSSRPQGEALLQWKNSLLDYDRLDSWSLNNLENLCNWTGITCNAGGTILKLNVSVIGLAGTLVNFSFHSFPNLISLDMSDNFFSDVIPAEIGKLTQLQYLSLFDNNLDGTIPYQISHLRKLKVLDLSSNFWVNSNWSLFLDMPYLTSLLLSNDRTDSFPPASLPQSMFTHLTNLEFLDLRGNHLEGPLPGNISKLSKLKELKLQGNKFSGSIPDEVGLLHDLELLELSENSFEGKIPSSIGQLKKLQTLDLRENYLNSSIPPELAFCTKLNSLVLAANSLTGPLPLSFTNLSQISVLDLSDNLLSGKLLPHCFSNWTELTHLQMTNNTFFGTIPSEIGMLGELQDLDLSRNCLAGSVPATIGNLTKLDTLNLFFNNLTGTIPQEIGNLTQLRYLDLNNNQLYGKVPDSISGLSNLWLLFLYANSFSGSIPKDLGFINIPDLMYFDLSKNNFSGEIPATLCQHTSLVLLDLSSNSLSGELTRYMEDSFTESCQLTYFNMNSNDFEGQLPLALANCKQLQILDLGNNKINGTIPSWLFTLPELQILVLRSNRLHGMLGVRKMEHPFPKLRILDLSHNQFSGNLDIEFLISFKIVVNPDPFNDSDIYLFPPRYLHTEQLTTEDRYYEASVLLTVKGQDVKVKKILNLYTVIDLSSNMFSGEIPELMGDLKSLRLLNLSHNSLTGHIPSLRNMSLLESLDLSSNQLSGTISSQLTGLTFLSSLNLSENHLSGAIPRGRQFDTFSNDSFLHNPALCGVPLTRKCRDDELPTQEVDDDDDDDVNWFDWQMALIGYGSGLVCGLSLGYIFCTTTMALQCVIFIEIAHQKLARKYRSLQLY